jgi:phenazine biosynthesis protein phzE
MKAAGPTERGADRGLELLEEIVGGRSEPFALIHRPETTGQGVVEVIVGSTATYERISDLPVVDESVEDDVFHDLLVLIPYRQIAERGFVCVDDGTPLTAVRVSECGTVAVAAVAELSPEVPVGLRQGAFDIDDGAYAELVRRVVADEIGCGEGANFVIKRSFLGHLDGFSVAAAVSVFGRLLRQELGAYWTFLVHTGTTTLIGASPERHVSVVDGRAVMNPISGTYRYPASGPSLDGVLTFLHDPKETDELYMVLDEELKMMGRVCSSGGRVVGPGLKMMARLAHTEYHIEGRTDLDPREVLLRTLFAPTVTGSPLESSCRVIADYEATGRSYYSGVLALLRRDQHVLDSTILIRTAVIEPPGSLRIDVGATLVRHSDPLAEAAETRAKAQALLAAFDGSAVEGGPSIGVASRALAEATEDPAVVASLARRNRGLSRFWFRDQNARRVRPGSTIGGRAMVIDCEDMFTSMLGHQLAALGLDVTIVRFDDDFDLRRYDLVVLGPGPGDPRDDSDRKIRTMRQIALSVISQRIPLLAICLGHQVLSSVFGLPLVRRERPNQGTRLFVDFFGRTEVCGFYNTFSARSDHDTVSVPVGGTLALSRDRGSCEIHAMRGPTISSLQFHPESVLTENGTGILEELLAPMLRHPAMTA